MTKALRYIAAFAVGLILIAVAGIIFLGNGASENEGGNNFVAGADLASTKVDPVFLDELKRDYSSINSIESVSTSRIELEVGGRLISGDVDLVFAAEGNKYRYESKMSPALNDAGLMRDMKLWFDGRQMYFYDGQAEVLSIQNKEDIHLPIAVPNPVFLPIDFFSSDSDECANCKLRLVDLKHPGIWDTRRNHLRLLHSSTNDGFTHELIEIPGGLREGKGFVYRVRLVGTKAGERQINSISMTAADGRDMVEILFSEFKTVDGFPRAVPFAYSVVIRDATSRVVARTESRIKHLTINNGSFVSAFAPNLVDFARIWDSEKKQMIKGN